MKKGTAALLMLLILCSAVIARAEKVANDFLSAYPDYQMEDCLKISDTPKGDYAFVLIRNAEKRMLLGFHLEESQWVQFLSSSNPVPQGQLPARFSPIPAGEYWRLWDDTGDYSYTANGLGFAIHTSDGTLYHEGVEFAWQEDGFHLVSYQYTPGCYVDLMENLFIFYTINNGFEEAGTAPLATNLDWIHFYSLPLNAEEITPFYFENNVYE